MICGSLAELYGLVAGSSHTAIGAKEPVKFGRTAQD